MASETDRHEVERGGLPQEHATPALAPAQEQPLVSVLVPCCGQIEYARLCVPALLRHSRRPCELIFLDVGSLDGTSDFLDGVAAAAPVRVEAVHVRDEGGFAAACQAGLSLARGSFVVWLNSDVLVTDSWLEQLVALASLNPEIGVVGPTSNCAPAPQRVSPVPYRLRPPTPRHGPGRAGPSSLDLAPLDRFASEWRERHRRLWSDCESLGGFCMLIKRQVLQQVSLFESGGGVLDADAFCRRVRRAGYVCAFCRDLYVHHFGSRLAFA